MKSSKEILVLGAGVSGLSTAILLKKAGYDVTIWAKELSPNTTSDKAAAMWYPYRSGPLAKVAVWSELTLKFFRKEIIKDKKSGCFERTSMELFREKVGAPWWAKDSVSYQRPKKQELPRGYVDGYKLRGLIMDTSIYMPYLMKKTKQAGIRIIKKEVKNINQAFSQSRIVINCTGLGSRALFNDKKVYPSRGQTLKVKLDKKLNAVADDESAEKLAYIIPRVNDIVLGGTAQDNNWNVKYNSQDAQDIMRKSLALEPSLVDAKIVGYSVGLRPVRDDVRLERKKIGSNYIIHNYGHGGSGFTLSWGCAQEVVKLVGKIKLKD